MKIGSLGAVLAKQFGVQAAEELAPDQPTLGDVTSPEELERYQQWKRDYKKASKVPETPEEFWERAHGALRDAAGRGMGHVAVRRRRCAPRALAPPVEAEAPGAAPAASTAAPARTASRTRSGRRHWLVAGLGAPSGLRASCSSQTRAHVDFPDLPDELARELGP